MDKERGWIVITTLDWDLFAACTGDVSRFTDLERDIYFIFIYILNWITNCRRDILNGMLSKMHFSIPKRLEIEKYDDVIQNWAWKLRLDSSLIPTWGQSANHYCCCKNKRLFLITAHHFTLFSFAFISETTPGFTGNSSSQVINLSNVHWILINRTLKGGDLRRLCRTAQAGAVARAILEERIGEVDSGALPSLAAAVQWNDLRKVGIIQQQLHYLNRHTFTPTVV